MNKILLAAFTILVSLPTLALEKKFNNWTEACSAAAAVLADGDILFLDVPDFLFRRVAKSTNTWTSHVGIAFKNADGTWSVRESSVPLSGERPLCEFLQDSSDFTFEIKRFQRALTSEEVEMLKVTSKSFYHRLYNFGFNFDSKRFFCSKFVYLTYKSIGIEVGEIQTFRELLKTVPKSSVSFWRFWFFGFIPWDRRTVTPASQLNDPKFYTVLHGS